MNSFKRFIEENLPDKKCFHRSLKNKITVDNDKKLNGNKECLIFIKVGNKFSMKYMGGYHGHYLKKDVLLLTDVFGKFSDMCLKFYKLDPFHYFRSPGLSWDAILKMTGVGISCITKRHSKVNDQCMKSYDPTNLKKLISYLDMTNLE